MAAAAASSAAAATIANGRRRAMTTSLVAGMAMLAGFGIMRLIKNANAAGGTHSGGDDGSARKSP